MISDTITTMNTYLTFRLHMEFFASAVSKVDNILEMIPITQVALAPAYIKGFVYVRGKVMPVIDTRLKLKSIYSHNI